ncbi:MAG: hypothetical protein M3309_15345, partial [Actinomycetota bacterium]|nr:hypothetical protein [Actinomycetota bacterium]
MFLALAGGCNVRVLFEKEVYDATFSGGHGGKAEWPLFPQRTTGRAMRHPLDCFDAALPVASGIDHDPLYKRAVFVDGDVQQVLYGIYGL